MEFENLGLLNRSMISEAPNLPSLPVSYIASRPLGFHDRSASSHPFSGDVSGASVESDGRRRSESSVIIDISASTSHIAARHRVMNSERTAESERADRFAESLRFAVYNQFGYVSSLHPLMVGQRIDTYA